MMTLLCIKQHLSTFEAQLMKKLSKTQAELKKSVPDIKKCVIRYSLIFTAILLFLKNQGNQYALPHIYKEIHTPVRDQGLSE